MTPSSGGTAWWRRNGSRLIEAKADLIRAYRTQVPTLFPGDGSIPVVPEVFLFFP